MKKTIIILTVLLSSFVAKSQSFDNVNIKNSLRLKDSTAIGIITDKDTLATVPWVRNAISTFDSSPWTDYGDSIKYDGDKVIVDTLKSNIIYSDTLYLGNWRYYSVADTLKTELYDGTWKLIIKNYK